MFSKSKNPNSFFYTLHFVIKNHSLFLIRRKKVKNKTYKTNGKTNLKKIKQSKQIRASSLKIIFWRFCIYGHFYFKSMNTQATIMTSSLVNDVNINISTHVNIDDVIKAEMQAEERGSVAKPLVNYKIFIFSKTAFTETLNYAPSFV